MLISYFKKNPEKNITIEVITECQDDGKKIGTIVDIKVHPLDYVPKGKILYVKEKV